MIFKQSSKKYITIDDEYIVKFTVKINEVVF